MSNDIRTTVVTAGDRAYSWGALLLVASMRMNGMKHPAVVGAMGWTQEMKRRVTALGEVTVCELPNSRQCVACQKPMLMGCDDVKTDWVCWADADGMFIGDCSEWLTGDSPDEIVIRRYDPVPPDFTEANLEIWRKDIEHYLGSALPESRYDTRFNNPFIVLHRSQFPFLQPVSFSAALADPDPECSAPGCQDQPQEKRAPGPELDPQPVPLRRTPAASTSRCHRPRTPSS